MRKIAFLSLTVFLFLSLTTFAQENYTGASEPDNFYHVDYVMPPDYAPNALSCLPCSLPENESDIQNDSEDVVNGGCNSSPAVFTDIVIGDVYCGRTNTYNHFGDNYRDTDWYRITLTEEKDLYWTSIADCPLNLLILEELGGCYTSTLNSEYDIPVGTVGQVSYTLSPGTYYFWVGLPVYDGWENGADYQVVLSEGTPPDPWCGTQKVPVSDWAIYLGIFLIAAFTVVRYRKIRLA